MYDPNKVQEAVFKYNRELIGSGYEYNILDYISHPFVPASSHVWDRSDPSVTQVGNKSAGCPYMGAKKDAWPGAEQYVSKVKTSGLWTDRYSTILGIRTQTPSEGQKSKERAIHMVSASDFIQGYEAFRDALNSTDNAIDISKDVFLFHTEPRTFLEWYEKKESEVVQWVNLDFSQFDSDVTASELALVVDYFAPNYEFRELEKEWVINASIMTPWGTVTRKGGMPSGWIATNLGDSYCNVLDVGEALHRYKLERYLVCIAVNGDDITLGLKTKLDKENLEKLSRVTRRTLNVEKVYRGDGVLNSSKMIERMDGELFYSHDPWETFQRTWTTERSKLAIDGSKEMMELRLTQQLGNVYWPDQRINNPIGLEMVKLYAKYDKAHLSTMSDDQLLEPAEELASRQQWRGNKTGKEVIDEARSTPYGSLDF
jgi:hypothetical protein